MRRVPIYFAATVCSQQLLFRVLLLVKWSHLPPLIKIFNKSMSCYNVREQSISIASALGNRFSTSSISRKIALRIILIPKRKLELRNFPLLRKGGDRDTPPPRPAGLSPSQVGDRRSGDKNFHPSRDGDTNFFVPVITLTLRRLPFSAQ